ncbi:BatD family protein [Halopseudomonas maritima]|uniref:BatD family protein n=1 Tax=Halopseudomonas maritima TaxID=2918528 RepID=UPI001EEB57B3|nr:BatD family protein [Halopseudomonas maritima]UJJ31799.1 BatD family protein [Halopseudomonas maritima]
MRQLFLLLVLLCCSSPLQAALQASVNRIQLAPQQTVELTLESTLASREDQLDLSPLQEHFQVLNHRRLSLVSQINGRTVPVTRWVVELQPLRTGFVVIPPLSLGGEHSDPVSLRVLTAEQLVSADPANQAAVFIDAEVDTATPYVQAQVLLTLRIYHSVSLYDDSTLSGLDIPEARVEALGAPKTYERTLDGVVHGVIEIRYAIYPQRSGSLEIPSQLFSATALQPRKAERNSGHNARFLQLRSPSLQLEVRPIPASYPADTPWLPARQVRLSQNWQPDPAQELQRGEPLTRTLSIQADGLTASQLPELSTLNLNNDDLRQYSDQPQLENQLSDTGILGLRQESSAVVTRHAGHFEIPAIAVQWWNTQTDQLETSELAAVQLNVRSNGAPQAPPPDWNLPASNEAPLLWPWQLICALLTCALLWTLHLLRNARSTLNSLQQLDEDSAGLESDLPDNPLADLQTACRHNRPAEARKALEHWAKRQDSDLISLSHAYPVLADALDELNACLFGQIDSTWRGKPLWRAVRKVTQARQREAEALTEGGIEPLYPDV